MSTKKDLFGDELTGNKQDFESMLDASMSAGTRKLRAGDQLRGEILAITKEESFVSTGTAVDGVIPTADLLDDKKELKYKVGDILDVVVVKIHDGEIRLSRKGSKRSVGDLDSLEDAFDMELPVEGRVLEAVKGGFRIQLMGHTAFCPISQLDRAHITDTTPYVGKKYDFIITKFEENGRNLVVSRRKILDQQKAESEAEFLEKNKIGDILEGQISKLEPFGAFVELPGGVEGLIHISELSWGRVKHPQDVIAIGTPVRVKLIKVDEAGDRLKLSFSLKQGGGEADPWTQIETNFPVGKVVEGVVEKKEVFGLFVQIAPGITGLFPKSKWRDSDDAAKYESKIKGDRITVQVDQISLQEHRLTLGVPGEKSDESWREHSAASKSGFGTFGDVLSQLSVKKK